MMHCSVLWLRFQHSCRDRTSLDFGHIVVNIASFTSNVNKDAVWRKLSNDRLWYDPDRRGARGPGRGAPVSQTGKRDEGQKGAPDRNVNLVVALNIEHEVSQKSDQEPVVVPARVTTLGAIREKLQRSGPTKTLK